MRFPVVLFGLALVAGCGSGTPDAPDADAAHEVPDVVGDDGDDPDAEDTPDTESQDGRDGSGADSWDVRDSREGWDYGDVPEVPRMPTCGDLVVDDGEECDDGNRLNGDGCDWLCQNGDGDPSPEPDLDAGAYEPAGPISAFYDVDPWGSLGESLPLAWTGSEFAVAFCEPANPDGQTIRFRRFDRVGSRIDDDWTYPAACGASQPDLVWNGAGFGLFYSEPDIGIWFLALDANGKPNGDPVLVEPTPNSDHPAADVAPDGYVLVWLGRQPGDGNPCDPEPAITDTIHARVVGPSGSTDGLPGPVEIEMTAGGPPAVATGPAGFGVTSVGRLGPATSSGCAVRFVVVNPDLSGTVRSGALQRGAFAGDVRWFEDRYFVAWVGDVYAPDHDAWCVARFTRDGDLERAPVCNEMPFPGGGFGLRLAAGDLGLGLVATPGNRRGLPFLRTDLAGRAVCDAGFVFDEPVLGPYGIVWADGVFGTVRAEGVPSGIWFRVVAPAD